MVLNNDHSDNMSTTNRNGFEVCEKSGNSYAGGECSARALTCVNTTEACYVSFLCNCLSMTIALMFKSAV